MQVDFWWKGRTPPCGTLSGKHDWCWRTSTDLQLPYFFTLVTGPGRSLSLKLSETRVHAPQIRARLVTTAYLCEVGVLILRAMTMCRWSARQQRQTPPKSSSASLWIARFYVETPIIVICKPGFNQNYNKFALNLLIKIFLFGKFPWTKIINDTCFHMRLLTNVHRFAGDQPDSNSEHLQSPPRHPFGYHDFMWKHP